MSLQGKPLEQVTVTDIEALQIDKTPEGKTLEYKETLPGNDYDSVKEFLADVSSFANAAGGDLLYGIKAVAGIPVELTGLELADVDAALLRLDTMIRTSIKPRIPGFTILSRTLPNDKVVIIIRVPRSWALPHVVEFQRHWRIYSRTSAGKYPLDIAEVRALAVASETINERIRSFRAERLGNIVAGQTPVAIAQAPTLVCHVVPLSAADAVAHVNIAADQRSFQDLYPIGASSFDTRFNVDGLLKYVPAREARPSRSYVQIFRSGAVEIVNQSLVLAMDEGTLIRVHDLESELLRYLPRLLKMQHDAGVEPPYLIMLSLLGVKNATLQADRNYARPNSFSRERGQVVDRDAVLIPEVVVSSLADNIAEVMRPVFDTIWNAAGYPASMNYRADGTRFE